MIDLEVSPGAQADAAAEEQLVAAQIGPTRQCIGRGCIKPAVHKYGDAKWRKLCTSCNKKRVEAHRSSRQSGPCACGNNSKAGETMCGPCLKANSSAQIWTAAIFQLTKVADDLSEMGMGPKAKLIREAIYAVENF